MNQTMFSQIAEAVNGLIWDPLNRAITKLFGHEAGKKKQPPNQMGDMAHFTVHDLRRTCRSLLAAQGTSGHVA